MITSGPASHRPNSARGNDREEDRRLDGEQDAADPECWPASLVACPLGKQRDGEHAQGQRRRGRAGLQRVVLEDHLQEDSQGDHRPAKRDLLERLPADPESEIGRPEEFRVDQRQLSRCCGGPATSASEPSPTTPTAMSRPTASAPPARRGCPGRCRPCRAPEKRVPTERSMKRGPCRTVACAPSAREDDGDDDELQEEADAPRQERRDEPADQRPDGRGDGRRGANERVDTLLFGALEVAVDERLHRRQQQRSAEAAEDRPEDDDRRGPGRASSPARPPRSRAGRGCTPSCDP